VGGIETNVQAISEGLVARGFEVEIMTIDPSSKLLPAEEINGVRVRRFRSTANHQYSPSLELVRALWRMKADIMHVHGLYNLTSPLAISLKTRVSGKCVFTLSTGGSSSALRQFLRIPFIAFMRRVVENVDKIVCLSQFELEHYQRLLDIPRSRLVVIPNAVNLNQVVKQKRNTSQPVLVTAGRLVKHKGFQSVIRSVKLFHHLWPEMDLRLSIVGRGPYESELMKETKKLEMEEYVDFLGWRKPSDFMQVLSASTAFVLLSKYESQAIVVCEALSAGIPVIVARNGALNEYVQRGYAVGVNNPEDPYEVAVKIKSVLDNPRLCKVDDYRPLTWKEVVQALANVYSSLGKADSVPNPR
jgi:1,2-diacylglycerol 3-alpha-glucosyltransferase